MGGVVDFVSTTRALCSRAPPCGGVPPVKCLLKPCSGLNLFLAFWNGCPVRLNPALLSQVRISRVIVGSKHFPYSL